MNQGEDVQRTPTTGDFEKTPRAPAFPQLGGESSKGKKIATPVKTAPSGKIAAPVKTTAAPAMTATSSKAATEAKPSSHLEDVPHKYGLVQADLIPGNEGVVSLFPPWMGMHATNMDRLMAQRAAEPSRAEIHARNNARKGITAADKARVEAEQRAKKPAMPNDWFPRSETADARGIPRLPGQKPAPAGSFLTNQDMDVVKNVLGRYGVTPSKGQYDSFMMNANKALGENARKTSKFDWAAIEKEKEEKGKDKDKKP